MMPDSRMDRLDAIIVTGDTPLEVLGKDVREKIRLTVDGIPASLQFLQEYFRTGRNAGAALQTLKQHDLPFLSLNGPYLLQFLEAHGFSAALAPVFDPHDERVATLLAWRPRAVLISTTFMPFARQIDATAAAIKRHVPDAVVIAGGIQVWKSYRHKALLEAGGITEDIRAAVAEHNYLLDNARPSPVDAFVVSDAGETTLVHLLERLRDGRGFGDLDNLAVFESGQWRLNRLSAEPYHEIKVDWRRFLDKPTRAYVPVQAGLGCHFRCTFCDFSGLRPVRSRTPESLLEEIRTIPPADDGLRRVYFTDDNLFPNRERVRDICGRLTASGMAVRWRGLIRLSVVNEETASLMAQSGCLELLLGVESGDAEMLRRMHKQITPDQILAGLETLDRHGINTKSHFIVGFPGETEETIGHTVDLLNAYPVSGAAAHRYMFFTFAVLPLSDVASAESRARYGLRGYGYDWSHETMNAKEAAAMMAAAQDRLKPELSPNYVLEVPEVPGLDNRAIQRVYALRNRLSRVQRGLAPESGAELWQALEGVFRSAGPASAKT